MKPIPDWPNQDGYVYDSRWPNQVSCRSMHDSRKYQIKKPTFIFLIFKINLLFKYYYVFLFLCPFFFSDLKKYELP